MILIDKKLSTQLWARLNEVIVLNPPLSLNSKLFVPMDDMIRLKLVWQFRVKLWQ